MAEGTLGERLMDLREERMWTQGELSERSGVSPATINKMENGHIEKPRFSTVRKLARALGVEPETLRPRSDVAGPKAQAQPEQTGEEAGLAYERSRHYRGTAEMGEIACAYWEERLEDGAGLSNDEVYSLASVLKPYANALEAATNAELRELRAQYPEEEDLRSRSVIEPVRFRWVGVLITASRRRIFDFPDDPDARERFRDLIESLDAQAKEHA